MNVFERSSVDEFFSKIVIKRKKVRSQLNDGRNLNDLVEKT